MHWRYTACVAGITMQRTSGWIFRPRSTSAAWRMSTMRPFVQEPMKAWSILMSRASAAGRVFDGRCGNDTVGTMEAASISYTFAYWASGSEWYSV